uniref:Mitochondrial import inner membrane translocase subunit TIM16 n=1 Tax=Rhabditophanes sp. KR3021 TaxID=114890 RepID=A0AC35TYA5_9BILA
MVFRNLAKIALATAEAVGKALSRAVKDEIKATQQASERMKQNTGSSGNSSARTSNPSKLGISLHESCQILNVKEPFDIKKIEENYTRMFEVNDKVNGGSLYLQSKIYRAKERIDEELSMREEKPDEIKSEDSRKAAE